MTMLCRIRRFLKDEAGPTATEYAVMLVLVIVSAVAAIGLVGSTFQELWQSNSDQIAAAVNGNAGSDGDTSGDGGETAASGGDGDGDENGDGEDD